MSEEKKVQDFEVTELEDTDLEDVAGGARLPGDNNCGCGGDNNCGCAEEEVL